MVPAFDASFVRLWFALRKIDGVIGVGFGPKIVDGDLVSPRQLVIYKTDKDSAVPDDTGAEIRLPRLSKRRITVRDRTQDCLTDYQWLFWDKIDRLNKRQRRQARADTTHRSAQSKKSKKKGSGPAALPAMTTRVVDNLYVIHDPAGSLVTQVGTETTINFVEAYRQFRREFGDDYDFLAFFVDTESGMPDIGNGSTPIFSDVTGIGRTIPDTRADWNSAKLRLCSHFTWVTLRTMLHEPAHLWCSYVHYRRSAKGPREALLHADFAGAPDQSGLHWGRFVEDGVSCMDYDRCDWHDNRDGTFHRFNHRLDETSPVRAKRFGYSPLDLYLMGLIGPGEVPPWTMICDPTPPINDNNFGPYTPANPPGAFQLSVQNVIFENGPRTPDHLNSPRVFHQATIVVTKDTDPNAFFIAEVAADQAEHVPNFRRATRGLAMMDCSLLRDNHGDLYIKHTPADDGTPSQSGDYFNSPDLWIRNSPDGKANFDSQMPIPGQDSWIYARVRNKGARPYQNVKVNFYVTSTAHLDVRYPNDWHPDRLIGTAIATVPPASGRGSSRADGFAILEVRLPSERVPAPAGASVLCEIIPMSVEPTKLHAVWENRKLAQRLMA
jgi:hypothetical protein